MAFLTRLWHGFVRLFGLDTCPLPPPVQSRTPRQKAAHSQVERLLRRS
jgi:hypothetical protein